MSFFAISQSDAYAGGTDKRTSDEVLHLDKDQKSASEKQEVDRYRYEECGQETEYFVIQYSDGTYEMVHEDNLPDGQGE